MSIVIKDIKMPEHCGQCFAYDTTYQVCNLYFMGIPNRMTSLEHRPEWCELVELPPHGRLIDADALTNNILLRTYIRFHTGETSLSEWMILGQHIVNAPTIFEAEGKEE